MAETFTYDATPPAEVVSSIEADEAESLAIGEELEAAHESLLAGKYKNAQELEQAYIELQKKLGGQDSDEEGYESEEEYQEENDEDSEDESEDPAVDFISQVNLEFNENGQLSEETLEMFSEMSSRELVEAYLRFQDKIGGFEQQQPQGVELSDSQVNQIKNSVGGDAAYEQLTSWASENLDPQEIEAFDQLVDTGNMPAINLALQALYYRYTDAMGYEGQTLQGKPARSMDSFRSQQELVRAMADPRYDSDPAYRQDVIDKLERSDIDF
jgi:hypothetical protein